MGETSRPGTTLANVTMPASGADPYSSSVNRTSATPTIWPLMRASCMDATTRPSDGMRSRAR